MNKCCTKCNQSKDLSEFYLKRGKSRTQCKSCMNLYSRITNKCIYYSNPQKMRDKQKEYYSKNKETINKKATISLRNKRKSDASYRLLCNLRTRMNIALYEDRKSASTKELIGCSVEQLRKHLQSTAIANGYEHFNINNYSGREYHIDHVIPCNSFNLKCSYHQKMCFHWSNLQILEAKRNIAKSDKLFV